MKYFRMGTGEGGLNNIINKHNLCIMLGAIMLIFVSSSLLVDCMQMENMTKVSSQITIFILDLTLEKFNTCLAV